MVSQGAVDNDMNNRSCSMYDVGGEDKVVDEFHWIPHI